MKEERKDQTHSFNICFAAYFNNVCKAILLKEIKGWCDYNQRTQKNFHEGKYWTRKTAKEYSEKFPYMNAKSIARWLSEMVDDGIIYKNTFNKKRYDKSLWHSVNLKKYHEILADFGVSKSHSQNEKSHSQNEKSHSQNEKSHSQNEKSHSQNEKLIPSPNPSSPNPSSLEVIKREEALSENFSGEHAADTEPKSPDVQKEKISAKKEKDWTANEKQLLRQIRQQEARMAGGELIEEEREEQPFNGQKQKDWEWFQKTYNRPVNMHDQVMQFARLSSADIQKIRVHLPGYIELLKAAKTPLKYWKKPHNYLKDRIYLDSPITQQEIEQAKNGSQKANTNRKGHQFNSDKQELVNSFFV